MQAFADDFFGVATIASDGVVVGLRNAFNKASSLRESFPEHLSENGRARDPHPLRDEGEIFDLIDRQRNGEASHFRGVCFGYGEVHLPRHFDYR